MARRRDLGPPWRLPGERIRGIVTVGGAHHAGMHRPAIVYIILEDGRIPPHLIPPWEDSYEQ